MVQPFKIGLISADSYSETLNSLEGMKVQKPQFHSTTHQIRLGLLDRLTHHLYLATRRNIGSTVTLGVPPLD